LRPRRHLVDTITELAERGIGFRSLQEAIDTTTPGGKLVFHVFAALAEFERDLIRARTTAGLAAARARGRHGGRPPVMTAHKVQVAQEMYRSGQYTVAAIAKTLGVSRASVYRHLTHAGEGCRRGSTHEDAGLLVGSAHEVEVFLRCWPSPPCSRQSWRTSRRSALPPGGAAPDPASFTLTRPMTATPTRGIPAATHLSTLLRQPKERDNV
jgi:hypothetical protein